jgi:hypothetical protein
MFTSAPPLWQAPSFAIERDRAASVLRTVSQAPRASFEIGFDVAPMSAELRYEADRESSGGAAIFPDGLAAFIRREITEEKQPIVWVRERGDFVSVEEWQKIEKQRIQEEFLEMQRAFAQPTPQAQYERPIYRYHEQGG